MPEDAKRLFISYAWESEEYRDWVRRLASRFRQDGVDVRLDLWHLQANDSIPEFMNRELRQADWVLVLCSPAYRSKVHTTEEGRGSTGVGWEARLLTGRLLAASENKILAALARGSWTEAAPDFLQGQIYYDLSDSETFEANYKTLMRGITGTSEKAPPLGKLPAGLEVTPPEPLRGQSANSIQPIEMAGQAKKLPERQSAPTSGRHRSSPASAQRNVQQIAAWIITAVLGFFLLAVFCFAPPALPPYKQQLLAYLCALQAGGCAFLWSGRPKLNLRRRTHLGQITLRAAGAVAVFTLVLLYWRAPALALVKDAREVTRRVVVAGAPTNVASKVQQDEAISNVAKIFNLKPEEVRRAIQTWTAKTPYERALQAFASGKYADASRILEAIDKAGEEGAEVDVATLLGESRFAEGRYREAAESFEKALAQQPDDPVLLNELGVTLYQAGDYPGARASFERVLKVSSEPTEVLHARLNLAQTTLAQGNIEEASKLGEQILPEMKRVFGTESPETLSTVNMLITILQKQGNFAGARERWDRLLTMTRKTFGSQAPETLTIKNNLALNLLHQGQYEEARKLQQEVVNVWEKTLGSKYPKVLTAKTNLALILAAQGRLREAYELQRPVLQSLRNNPDIEHGHGDTLAAMEVMAFIQRKRGDLSAAKALYQEDLNIRLRGASEEDPDILVAQGNLALVLRDQGDLVGARTLQDQALEGTRRRLGEEHPNMLAVKDELAVTLRMQGELSEARRFAEQALAGRREILGEKHPRTLTAKEHFASILKAQGDLKGARELLASVVEERRRILGPRHPDTSVAEWLLASVLQELSDGEAPRQYLDRLQWLRDAEPEDLSREQREIAAKLL